jgi:hypothetical protein
VTGQVKRFDHGPVVVEVDSAGLVWRKSRASNGPPKECVEWAVDGAAVLVRNSRNRTGGRLSFPRAAWAGFLGRLR